MRSSRVALLTLVAVAACTTQQARRSDTTSPATATLAGAPAGDAAASKAIQAADSAQGAALIRGDTAGAAAYYADDAIVMAPNDNIAKGHDAIVKAIGNIFAAGKITAFSTHREDLLVTGEYAIETLSYAMTIQPKTGKPMSDKGKGLTVFKKQSDGSYKAIRDIFNSDLPAK
jgi:ketosteroid isomerase-like protein